MADSNVIPLFKGVEESVDMNRAASNSSRGIHIQDLDDIFHERLGVTYRNSVEDNRGCYMSHGSSHRLSPMVVTDLVREILELADVEIEGLDFDDADSPQPAA